jgi:hypothetical protein
MTIPFPSAEDSNESPQRERRNKTQTATGGSLFSLRLVTNSLKWQSSDCYYAVALAVNSVWILLIDLKAKVLILVKDFYVKGIIFRLFNRKFSKLF